jgi:hypothetical protein
MAGDPYYFDNVALLLHCDGANNSTAFTDSSPRPKAISVIGGAKVSTAQSKFGGSSAYFDGTGDYLSIADHSDFTLGSGDFTIEAFVYIAAMPSPQGTYIVGQIDSLFTVSAGSFFLAFNGSCNPSGFFATGNSLVQTVAPTPQPLNQWSHLAYTRNGTELRLFVDGILAASTTSAASVNGSSQPISVGRPGDYNGAYLNGYIDDLRITKGVARYTGNFTPPAAPFPDYLSRLSGSISESLAANTFIARAYDVADGSLVGSKTFADTNNFTINIKTQAKACLVTVSADGTIWQPNVVYALDAKVFPTDPSAKPYYYKRLAAGTSGAAEPTWPTTVGGRCDDNGVTDAWELVERLIQPITHGPLIPS